MKKHKMFAWLTVFCFLMTIITGYEKNKNNGTDKFSLSVTDWETAKSG